MSSEFRRAEGQSGLRLMKPLLLFLCLALLSPPVFGQGKPDKDQEDRKWNIRRVERLKDYRDHQGKVRPDLWKKGVEHAETVSISAGVSRVPAGSAKADAPAAVAAAPITGVQWVQRGPQGIVKLTGGGDNRFMESLYRCHRFPPEIIGHAIWRSVTRCEAVSDSLT